MKKSLIGCGAICVLGLGLFIGLGTLFVTRIFAMTQPVVDASQQFLALLGQEKFAEAYASSADGLRAQQGEAAFADAVKQLGLTDFRSVSWHNRQIENQEGLAEGTVTTQKGDTKPVSVRLVKEKDKWAVVGLRYGGVDLATIRASTAVPAQADLERMVAEALLSFNQAVKAKDFVAFHGKLSQLWKQETTPERLQKAFQPFMDQDIDIGGIKEVKPTISLAGLSDGSALKIAGYYPTKPSHVGFELKYTNESGNWKLMGILVNVGKDVASK
jgi:hypothetical protein